MDETHPATILVVDDEHSIVQLVRGYLEREYFQVIEADDGPTAVELARRYAPDVIVLDLMLPGMDGLEVTRQIRTFSDAYVLMLTARSEEIDRIVGLTVGADDYVTKPFSPRELVARIHALLRRSRSSPATLPGTPAAVSIGDLTIDDTAYEVRQGNDVIDLTPIEYRILATLASHPGMVFTRSNLIEQVWGRDFFGDEHVVDVHVSNLRRKLEPDPASPRYIETVRGVGYRLRKSH